MPNNLAEIIFSSIFMVCLLGITVIVVRKIPVLSKLQAENYQKARLLARLNGKIKEHFSFELVLQKLLSKVRISSLKIEQKSSHWLGKLRQKNLNKKQNSSDSYWDDLKPKDEPK